ncbi:DUF2867 domain-containing protein [Paraburkholderia sp. D15]|uniref:DUF2867 domain-containing protein n=1 Tax=Paraburkholderia sp. D15 TaxID=2880218 RepID=UPI0032B07EA6
MHTDAKIEQAGLPPASQLMPSYGRAEFADAFSVDLQEAASHDAEFIARHIFDHQPEWIAALLVLRDFLVRPFGLKRAADLRAEGDDRINIFRVFGRYPNEIVLGEDDTHLNFRVSVLVQPPSDGRPHLVIVNARFLQSPARSRFYRVDRAVPPHGRATLASSCTEKRMARLSG